MKQPIYNTALYLRLSRDDDNAGESNSIATQRMMLFSLEIARMTSQRQFLWLHDMSEHGFSQPSGTLCICKRPSN